MSRPTGHRQTERILVGKPIRLTATTRSMWARLLDVSATGARIFYSGSTKLAPRSAVLLEWEPVPGLPLTLRGQVIWHQGEIAGVRFRALSAQTTRYLRAIIRFNRN